MKRVLDIDFDNEIHRTSYNKKLKLSFEEDSDSTTVDFNKDTNIDTVSNNSDSEYETTGKSINEVIVDVERGTLNAKDVKISKLTSSTVPKVKKLKKKTSTKKNVNRKN